MSTRPLRFLTTATLLLLTGMLTSCNQLFFAEVSLPQLCVTLDSQQFDGQDGDYHADVTFGPQSIDVSSYLSALPKDDAEIQLRVLTGTLTVKGGVDDLSFIDAAQLTIDPPTGSTLTELKLIDYTKDPNAPTPGSIELTGSDHPDLYPYLSSGNITTTIHFAGTLPAQDWTADLTVCISASAKVQYLEAAQSAQAAAK